MERFKYFCSDCRRPFKNKASKAHHAKGNGENCWNHLRCKVTNHEHDYLLKEFKSLKDAQDYILAEELDSKFMIRTRQKKMVLYNCNRRNYRKELPKRTKKLADGCPASFMLHERNLARHDLIQNNSFSSKTDNTECVWILRGCLTHSHEQDDANMTKLSQRVRMNMVMLLNLGIPLHTIRKRYLGMDLFGGSTGKIPSIKFLEGFMRRYYAPMPDLKVSEMEMVSRYIMYQAVRSFNVNANGISKKARQSMGGSKDYISDLSCQRQEVQTDELIVVMMNPKQREVYREFPGSLIVIHRPNVLPHIVGCGLISLCIVGKILRYHTCIYMKGE